MTDMSPTNAAEVFMPDTFGSEFYSKVFPDSKTVDVGFRDYRLAATLELRKRFYLWILGCQVFKGKIFGARSERWKTREGLKRWKVG